MLNFSSKAFFCSQLMPALWIVLLLPSLRGRDDIFGSVVLGAPDEPELAVAMDLASGKGTDPGVSRKARSGHSRSRPGQLDKFAASSLQICQIRTLDKLAATRVRQEIKPRAFLQPSIIQGYDDLYSCWGLGGPSL